MRKRLVAAALCAVMALALLPGAALAANATTVKIGSVELNATTPYYHNGAGGAQGTATDVDTGYNAYFNATNSTLTLNGLNFIDSNATAVIDPNHPDSSANMVYAISAYGDISLVLNGDSTVSTVDTATDHNYCVNIGGALAVSGQSSLTATAGEATGSGKMSVGIFARTGNNAILTVSSGRLAGQSSNAMGSTYGIAAYHGITVSGTGSVIGTSTNFNSSDSYGVHTQEALTVSGSGSVTGTGGRVSGTTGWTAGVSAESVTVSDSGSVIGTAGKVEGYGNGYGVKAKTIAYNGGVLIGNTQPTDQHIIKQAMEVAPTISAAPYYWRTTSTGAYTPGNFPAGKFPTDGFKKEYVELTTATPTNVTISIAVTLYPTSDSTGVTLNATTPYFVNNTATATSMGKLGENGCTAYFHDGTLELKDMDLNGAGNANAVSSVYSAVYSSSGDLTIKLHGDNSIAMADKPTASSVQARALYVKDGSLTFTGDGALNVSTGDGYGTLSAAVACAGADTCVTVDSGVSLTATVGSSTGTDEANYGIYAEMLLNHGTISATGDGAGIYLNSSGSPISVSDGKLTAEGKTGSGLIISEDDTFMVNGGMVELKGAAGQPAIGKTPVRDEPGILALGPSVTNGLLGATSTSAAVFSAEDIRAKYKSAAPVYSYMRLPASPAAPASASGGPSVYYKGGNTFGASRSDAPTAVLINNTPVPFSANNGVITVSSMPAGANWVTVRWNSTSASTNFTPNGVVTAISNVELPKTGDASVLAMALCGLAAAAAVFKKR